MQMPDWHSWLTVKTDAGLTFFPEILAFWHLLIKAKVSWFSSSLVCPARSKSIACLSKNRTLASLKARQCTINRAMLHLNEILCTRLSYAAPYFFMLHPPATQHTAELYAAPYWATLHPTDLHCILFLSYAAPTELHFNLWAIMHHTELCCILMSYTTPHPTELHYTLLSYAAPCWATSPTSCTLLSYAAPFWIIVHLLSNAEPSWATGHTTYLCCSHSATLHPIKLWCTLLSSAAPPMG
jgi:hypothetical protein